MANHKAAAPEWLNSEYMQQVLRKIENSPNLKVNNVDITPGSAIGDNYTCQILRILVNFKENNLEKQISLIGKFKVKTKFIEKVETVTDPFVTEAHFFNDMPALFKKVLKKSEIDFLPKCLYLDWENNLIIMEDLVAINYKLQPRGVFLNKKQCTLVLEGLAEMHGASYAALKLQPNLKDKYSNSLLTDKAEGPIKTIIDNSLKCLEKCIKLYGLPSNQVDELMKFKDKLDVHWFNICKLKEDCLNFLVHGDTWINNIMFHSSGEKVKLLDFQVYNYNSFANDLQYFLFTSVSADVIINYMDYLLETYFNKLRSVAPDIPNLTLERVKREFADRYFFGYTMTLVFRPATSSKIPPDMEKIMEGKETPMGFDGETFVKDFPFLMTFFEKLGVF